MQREVDIFSFARCGSPCGYFETYKNRINYNYLTREIELKLYKNDDLESFTTLFYNDLKLLTEKRNYTKDSTLDQIEYYHFGEGNDSIIYLTKSDTSAISVINSDNNANKIVEATKFYEYPSALYSKSEYYFDKNENLLFRIYYGNAMPKFITKYIYKDLRLVYEFTIDLEGNYLTAFYYKYNYK